MSVRLPVGVVTNGALYFSFALRVGAVSYLNAKPL